MRWLRTANPSPNFSLGRILRLPTQKSRPSHGKPVGTLAEQPKPALRECLVGHVRPLPTAHWALSFDGAFRNFQHGATAAKTSNFREDHDDAAELLPNLPINSVWNF